MCVSTCRTVSHVDGVRTKNTGRSLVVTASRRISMRDSRRKTTRRAARARHKHTNHQPPINRGDPMTPQAIIDRWMTYADAATYLQVSRKTLERGVTANRVPYHRDPLTGRVRFLKSEIDDWMHGKRRRGLPR